MLRNCFVITLVIFFINPFVLFAQNQLDPRSLDPEIDPDIDMYIESCQNSPPIITHGGLVERMILTRWNSNPLKPVRKGEVLTFINRFSFAILEARKSTEPTTLKCEQEILYIVSGRGVIKAGRETYELREGIFFLVPAELKFTIAATGDEPLMMYLVNEPIPENFRPNRKLLIKDENAIPLRRSGYLTMHWSHNGKNIFAVDDGLGTIESINLLIADPMTIGHPHSHGEGTEEIWHVTERKNLAFLGREIRWQPAGTAYMVPPTGFTAHSNINAANEPVKYLYFARYRDHEVRK
ncbi:cupin domain-containing protein [Candidatus Latescibacterota bacterium]